MYRLGEATRLAFVSQETAMTLLIISHTEHYKNTDGGIIGFGPTIKEIDYLAEKYGHVIHVACLHPNKVPPKSAVAYKNKNVTFVPIPPYGGNGIKKLSIFTNTIKILRTISRELKKADVFQFRAPTSMGMYVIPYLTLFSKKKGWYKYAGNWTQEHPPISYSFQKWWLLKLQNRLITINGKWPGQPAKCISFENPCLSASDRGNGAAGLRTKSYAPPFTFCFVGRIENEKGIFKVIKALHSYPDPSKIGKLEIVGDGIGMKELTAISETLPFEVQIHGSMARDALFEIYKKSHFFILPSESEGFPKVIAEAANFGCIPIVSDVSCIGQYINSDNGFLWNNKQGIFEQFFDGLVFNDVSALAIKAKRAHEFAADFTYERYIEHLDEAVINN